VTRTLGLVFLLVGCASHGISRFDTDAGATQTDAAAVTAPDAGPVGCSALAADRGVTLEDPGVYAFTAPRSIVWDGSRYAVLWTQRESLTPNPIFAFYIAFAEADGTIVPGSAHRVFPAGKYQLGGALALGDGELGLGYVDQPLDGLTEDMLVHFVRLDLDGTPKDGTDVPMADVWAPQLEVAIAYSPALAQWAVVWDGQVPIGGGYEYDHQYLSRVGAANTLLQPDAVAIDGRTASDDASIVWANDRWAAAISEYDLDTTGHVSIAEIDPTTVTVTHRIALEDGVQPISMALATDGTRYGAAWVDMNDADPATNAGAFRIADVGGDALGAAPIVIGDDRSSGPPDVAFDGTTFRVVESEDGTTTGSLWLTRVSRDGDVLGTPGSVADRATSYDAVPSIASDGCNDAIAWSNTVSADDGSIQLDVLAGSAKPISTTP
jgi:hypothetical protein